MTRDQALIIEMRRILDIQVRLEGMKAANQLREWYGQIQAYTEGDFLELSEECEVKNEGN